MADIKNITIDGTTYDLKDAKAREDVSDLKEDLQDDLEVVTGKMLLKASNNKCPSDSFFTLGYVGLNGRVYESDTAMKSEKIRVNTGDVIRVYASSQYGFTVREMRFVTAYDVVGNAIPGSGVESQSAYTVPSGVDSIIITIANASTLNNFMITVNYTASSYEAYFPPYYIALYDFIQDALEDYNIPNVTPKGYNLLPNAESGLGYYYWDGSIMKFGSASDHTYYIVDVKPNTLYALTANAAPRFYALLDSNGGVVEYDNSGTGHQQRFVNTGNGVKLYITYNNSYLNTVSLIEGYSGSPDGLEKPAFLNDISLRLMNNKYACTLPRNRIRFTQGIDEKFYWLNMFALSPTYLNATFSCGGRSTMATDGVNIDTQTPGSDTNSYRVNVYDQNLAYIDAIKYKPFSNKTRNLYSCSAIVIGDSEVEHGVMTQKLMDGFAADGKTITLRGTRGTAPNLTEGRAGWTAKQYCTVASSGTVTNAFWNPNTNKFDFAYYMNQQGYSAIDFVIINIAGNDLYNASLEDTNVIPETIGYVFEMIDSVLAYNANQKIILNLPSPPNGNVEIVPDGWRIRNMYGRYSEAMQVLSTAYSDNVLRLSHTHLVLNPMEDINDNIHPKEQGYVKMANELINQINNYQN